VPCFRTYSVLVLILQYQFTHTLLQANFERNELALIYPAYIASNCSFYYLKLTVPSNNKAVVLSLSQVLSLFQIAVNKVD